MKILFIALMLLVPGSRMLFAQGAPDIVWTTNAHGYGVSSVAISGDSLSIASCSLDHIVKVWAATNATLVRMFILSEGGPLSVALSSGGSLVGAGDGDGKSRVWRVSDGAPLWFGGPNNELVYSVSFSPDDSLLAIGRSDGLNVRHAQTGGGIPFGEPEDSKVFSVCFSPDGMALASANENHNASLWAVPAGTLIRDFIGHSNAVNSVDFSPDGAFLATGSADGTARIWNVTNAVALRVMEGGGGIAKFSSDAKFLFTLSDGSFKIWRVSSGACVGSITNTGALTFDIAKNGKYLAYGRGDGAVVLARMPLIIDSITRTGSEAILQWQGGSGLYQLQSRTNFTSDSWQNLGGTTTNTTSTNISSTSLFFRVQSLPTP